MGKDLLVALDALIKLLTVALLLLQILGVRKTTKKAPRRKRRATGKRRGKGD
ncbi:hypothetical protein [Alicyclobacillus mengziensis]|uniref:Uncharacterized protein n=1 Tax=Alicyclobacillus mengziensis TaxID=2931921 RepID=A0A9X7Z9T0_9BACL|nr:hypothetical protein [Alicyclobacillus mengziensis]QSO50120.1 hypothetical protein JZ786_24705 [Alicyclobacillus mengziensis]